MLPSLALTLLSLALITLSISGAHTAVSGAYTRDTRDQCTAQGITFIPMVMDAVGGGWGRVARGVWSELAKSSALAMGELQTERSCAMMLRQRLSMTLHRENARACLKRFAA